MLKAKLDSVRKNKKGFSLVELIIVVAIMVALIAVLAPSYVKYVTRSRDSALQTAAEDLATAIKTEYADPDANIKKAAYEVYVTIKDSKLYVQSTGTDTTNVTTAIETLGGVDKNKTMRAGTENLIFKINISDKGVVTGPITATSLPTSGDDKT